MVNPCCSLSTIPTVYKIEKCFEVDLNDNFIWLAMLPIEILFLFLRIFSINILRLLEKAFSIFSSSFSFIFFIIKYKDYFDWQEAVATAPSHRVLAMRRGEKEEFLTLRVVVPDEEAISILEEMFVKSDNDASRQVKLALDDCFKRLMSPSMETEVRSETKIKADDKAIKVFAENLRQLLMAPPLGQKNVLGIDPSSASTLAKDKGIPTEVDFFNERTALRVERKYGKAKVITATNVFAHVNDLDSFMRGITAVLREDGVFVSESGFLLDMVLTLGYDAIYHEHLRYYSLRPLKALFERFGMEVFDVERIQSHSGSIGI